MRRDHDAPARLRAWLGLLYGDYPPGALVEVAHARRDRDGRLWMARRDLPARYIEAARVEEVARLVERNARAGREVFCGVLPRTHPTPRAAAVGPGRVVWVDLDDPGGLERARGLAPAWHLAVASGSGGAHLYWLLDRPVAPEALERLNAGLARLVGADRGACDRLRLLRAPGSANGKAGAPARLLGAHPEVARHNPEALARAAPPPPPRAPPGRRERGSGPRGGKGATLWPTSPRPTTSGF